MTIALQTLSLALFEPLIGERFDLSRPDGLRIEARLVRCSANPRGTMPGAARTAFDLVFSAPSGGLPVFTGGTFMLAPPGAAPVGPVYVERIFSSAPDEALFQIVFN